jgi:hypothetical protein
MLTQIRGDGYAVTIEHQTSIQGYRLDISEHPFYMARLYPCLLLERVSTAETAKLPTVIHKVLLYIPPSRLGLSTDHCMPSISVSI